MRPLIVLILVVGAIAALLFVVSTMLGGESSPQALPGAGPAPVESPRPVAPEPANLTEVRERPDPSDAGVEVTERTSVEPENAASGAVNYQNSLSGLVQNQDGAPVAEARVTLTKDVQENAIFADPSFDRSEDITVATSSEGRFVFRNIPPFEYYGLEARHPDYALAVLTRVVVPATGDVVESTPLVMSAGPRFFGQVTDTSGAPVRGAKLVLGRRLFEPPGFVDPDRTETTSDDTGNFEFRNVLSVQHAYLTVTADGYGSVKVPGLNFDHKQEVRRDIVLAAAEMLGGKVYGPNDAPIEGARVLAFGTGGRKEHTDTSETATGPDGSFLFDDLAQGTYSLSFSAQGYKQHAQQRIETGDLNVVVRLVQRAVVSGTVLAEDTGAPVPMGTVRLRTVVQNSAMTTPTQHQTSFQTGDGKFEITDVAKGTYLVEAEAPGYAPTYSHSFTVTEGQSVPGIEVRLGRGGTITGRVVDPSGNPVAGVQVSTHDKDWTDDIFMRSLGDMLPTDATTRSTHTGADGRFELKALHPAVYQVRVRGTGYSTTIVRDLAVSAGATKDIGDVYVKRGGSIRGVIFLGGQPLAGAMVQLVTLDRSKTDGPLTYDARSDTKGQYHIQNVNEGRYELRAVPGTRPADSDPIVNPLLRRPASTEVVIRENDDIKQDLIIEG